jgi:hypothetical protein
LSDYRVPINVQTNIAPKWENTLTRITLKLVKTFITEFQIANIEKYIIKRCTYTSLVDIHVISYCNSNLTRETYT